MCVWQKGRILELGTHFSRDDSRHFKAYFQPFVDSLNLSLSVKIIQKYQKKEGRWRNTIFLFGPFFGWMSSAGSCGELEIKLFDNLFYLNYLKLSIYDGYIF